MHFSLALSFKVILSSKSSLYSQKINLYQKHKMKNLVIENKLRSHNSFNSCWIWASYWSFRSEKMSFSFNFGQYDVFFAFYLLHYTPQCLVSDPSCKRFSILLCGLGLCLVGWDVAFIASDGVGWITFGLFSLNYILVPNVQFTFFLENFWIAFMDWVFHHNVYDLTLFRNWAFPNLGNDKKVTWSDCIFGHECFTGSSKFTTLKPIPIHVGFRVVLSVIVKGWWHDLVNNFIQ